jgi:5'-methylthioadenosine phosphorylase
LYDLEGIVEVEPIEVDTPFGPPSSAYMRGIVEGRELYFLPRHGEGHRLLPSEINHRANIYGFKALGVDRVLSISAVGSLREELRPRDMVLPDQYYDRTKQSREHTFFGDGLVAHVSFGSPTCSILRDAIEKVARQVIAAQDPKVDVRINNGGTYCCMEGPAFSTEAESHIYRQLGCDVIGMTSLPEAKLCREAEICYQGISMVTDYDSWRHTEENVSVDMVISHLLANTSLAKQVLLELVPTLDEVRDCGCGSALKNALMTQRDSVPLETLRKLAPIVGKYFG